MTNQTERQKLWNPIYPTGGNLFQCSSRVWGGWPVISCNPQRERGRTVTTPSLTLFEVALLDTEHTDNTDKEEFVPEIVRFLASIERHPKSHDFGSKTAVLRVFCAFRVLKAQLQN